MTPPVLLISERAYRSLAAAYPPDFRRRFALEMAQVFRSQCREAYQRSQAGGVLRLWLPALWDWAWTASRQWWLVLTKRGGPAMDTNALDRQMSDLTWSIAHGLYAGYSLRQILEMLVQEAPEPSRSAVQQIWDDLQGGAEMEPALLRWKAGSSSSGLARLVDAILVQRKTGGNLARQLEPLSVELLRQSGSDPAFYAAMRRQAEQLGAPLPERAKEQPASSTLE